MLMRRLAPEPIAAVADRSRRCAGFGAVLAVMAILMGRGGAVDPRGALAVLGFALVFAIVAIVLVLWSAVVIWRTGYRGTARALAAFVISAAVLAYPVYLAVSLSVMVADQSVVRDVSTDPANPPSFSSAAAALAMRSGVVFPEPSTEDRETQRRAYPGLAPVMLDLPGDEAYGLALKAVRAHGWRVVEAVSPKGKFGTGHIEAVATTRVMALPEDVAIRIRPAGGQTRIDIRSASRFGPWDFGANAARIQSLSDELQDADP